MANIKSAKKRVLITKKKTLRNKSVKTELRTYMKKYEIALSGSDKTKATEAYRETITRIDKAAAKGLLHKNNAARKKSRYTKKLNALNAGGTVTA